MGGDSLDLLHGSEPEDQVKTPQGKYCVVWLDEKETNCAWSSSHLLKEIVPPGQRTTIWWPPNYTQRNLAKSNLVVTGDFDPIKCRVACYTDNPDLAEYVTNGSVYTSDIDGIINSYKPPLPHKRFRIDTDSDDTDHPSNKKTKSGREIRSPLKFKNRKEKTPQKKNPTSPKSKRPIPRKQTTNSKTQGAPKKKPPVRSTVTLPANSNLDIYPPFFKSGTSASIQAYDNNRINRNQWIPPTTGNTNHHNLGNTRSYETHDLVSHPDNHHHSAPTNTSTYLPPSQTYSYIPLEPPSLRTTVTSSQGDISYSPAVWGNSTVTSASQHPIPNVVDPSYGHSQTTLTTVANNETFRPESSSGIQERGSSLTLPPTPQDLFPGINSGLSQTGIDPIAGYSGGSSNSHSRQQYGLDSNPGYSGGSEISRPGQPLSGHNSGFSQQAGIVSTAGHSSGSANSHSRVSSPATTTTNSSTTTRQIIPSTPTNSRIFTRLRTHLLGAPAYIRIIFKAIAAVYEEIRRIKGTPAALPNGGNLDEAVATPDGVFYDPATLQFPAKDSAAVLSLEEKLNEVLNRKLFIYKFSGISNAKDLQEAVNKILNKVLAPEVAKSMSLTGKGRKKDKTIKYYDLANIASCLLESVRRMKHFRPVPENEIDRNGKKTADVIYVHTVHEADIKNAVMNHFRYRKVAKNEDEEEEVSK